MNKILFTFLFFILTFANAQSNRERLEDIQDTLDRMEMDRDFREYQRMLERNSIQPQQKIEKQALPNLGKDVYKNTMNSKQLNSVSSFWNLSISEYIKRDELGENICGKDVHTKEKSICFTSIMLNITTSET